MVAQNRSGFWLASKLENGKFLRDVFLENPYEKLPDVFKLLMETYKVSTKSGIS